MEWEFRKTLESLETYKKTYEYRNEIEKGDSNVLKMCLREIEIIMSEPKEKIISKVLAMRVDFFSLLEYLRDIMILGRKDVIEGVQRLVPHILKICSYALESDDPNRGETFFHSHPNYLKTSNSEIRTEINLLGSTYLILSLESILHWAKWIPFDEGGSRSMYAKAYNDLIERGVCFPLKFHYYKQSDMERFKNTYKFEVFADSYQEEATASSEAKINAQEIVHDSFEEEELSIVKISSKPGSNVKTEKSPKKEVSRISPSSEELLKKQEYEQKSKIYELKLLIDEKEREIANLAQIYQKEKKELIEDYERKIKNSLIVGNKEKDRPLVLELEFENDQLKKKLNILETELLKKHSMRSGELESENTKLEAQAKKLKAENQNLITIIKEKNEKEEKEKEERESTMSKIGNFLRKIEYLENENIQLKENLMNTNRTIASKDMEIIDLREELRRYQTKLKDLNEKKTNMWTEAQNVTSSDYLTPDKPISPEKDQNQQILTSKTVKYNNYQDLYLKLKPTSKESFLRLCRSAFKKKDILFKENELEIGVITEILSDNKVSFLLHLTNLAEIQINCIKIEPLMREGSFISTLHYELSLQNIFCIGPQEQEKVQCIVTNAESPFIKDRSVISISYEEFYAENRKNGVSLRNNIFLPFMIPKFLINSKPVKPSTNPHFIKEELIFRYSKKMLPRPSYIKSYFENILERIENKKYEVELYHRETDLNLYLAFSFEDNENLIIESIVLREKMNEKQKYIMEETLGFIEVAFKK